MTDHLKFAVIYCRVSTEEQAKKGESLSNQEKRCREFAAQHGYILAVEPFIERGESARTANRTELKKMLNFCFTKKNNISAVICLKVDRFTRNPEDFLSLTKALDKSKIHLLFVEEPNEKNANSNLVRNIKSVFAGWESEINSERTKAGMQEAVMNGRWLKKMCGYSFQTHPVIRKSVLTPNEDAKHIKKMFDLVSQGLYSMLQIIGIMKKDGFYISKQTLSPLLRNPVYCGLLPDIYNQNDGKHINGVHEPLISQELFFKVQDILCGRRATAVPKLKNNPQFPLRQFVYSPKCGGRLTASNAKSKSGALVPYYHCHNHKGCPRFSKQLIEDKYLKHLYSIQASPKALELYEKMVVEQYAEQTKTVLRQNDALKREVEAMESEKLKTISLTAKGIISEENGKIAIEDLDERINEKKCCLSDVSSDEELKEAWEFAKKFMLNIGDLWKDADLDLKQRIQCLTTPLGFVFRDNLVQPIRNPYFTRVFRSKQTLSQTMGG